MPPTNEPPLAGPTKPENNNTPTPELPAYPVPVADEQVTSSISPAPSATQTQPTVVSPSPKLSGRRKLLVFAAVGMALLLGGGVSAYYLTVVLPSQPENLWQTALERTAKGYDSLVEYSKQSKDMRGMTLKGDYKLEGPFKTDGTFEVQTYDQTGLLKADVGIVGARVTVEGRMIDAANSANPDVYIKAIGLKGVAPLLGEYGPLASQYDNQWIAIDHTLFDNLEALAAEGEAQKDQSSNLTGEDFTKISEVVGTVSKEYVLTTDPQRAILTVVKQVGRENKDGREVYHYQIGLHKQHTKDYLNALVDSLQNTPATKLTSGRPLREVIDMNATLKAVDDYKETDYAHVYVDLETKLISKVRVELGDVKQNYIEVSQNYTGGDVLPFAFTWYDNTDNQPSTLHATVNLNKKTNTTEGNLSFEAPAEGDEKAKLSAKYTVTTHNTPLTLEKPEGAKSVYELLGPLLSGFLTSGGSATVDSRMQI